MEIITFIWWHIKRYAIAAQYTDEQLKYYKSIGCEGMENQYPYDPLIIAGGIAYTILFGLFLTFSRVESLVSVIANIIFLILVHLYLFIIGPLLEKDNKRIHRNIERMEREQRRLDIQLKRLDEK